MQEREITLRVDVDFHIDLKKAVPYLLNLFEKNGVKATFFIVMGPDSMFAHKKRVKKKGYIHRLLSMNIAKLGNVVLQNYIANIGKDILYVGRDLPHIIKDIESSGHEIGVHGFNHSLWADNCWESGSEFVECQIEKAYEEFDPEIKLQGRTWGAPNWRCVEEMFGILSRMNIGYSSDMRGVSPFMPRFGSNVYDVIQYPITLPCFHEMTQAGVERSKLTDVMLSCDTDSYNMLCIHGYYEGLMHRKVFTEYLYSALDKGRKFVSLKETNDKVDKSEIVTSDVVKIHVPGGFSQISCQKEFLENNYFELMSL